MKWKKCLYLNAGVLGRLNSAAQLGNTPQVESKLREAA